MAWIDWLIVLAPALLIGGLAIVLQRHMRSVADFMAASRLAGRYLITNAGAEMGLTVVAAVALFEMIQRVGFTLSWWGKLSVPISLLLTLWGFVIYRYRETRVMTLAQFFEIRYSKSFRIFAGFLGFVSGVINYAIFPALAGRFFIYYCGLPLTVTIGSVGISTMAIVMALYLSVSLTLTLTGGQLTIMVTDCVGSLITMVFYTIVIIFLLHMFSWTQIYTAMSNAPQGQSLLDPFDISDVPDFNIWYALISVFTMVYGYMTWQGGHAFNNCAINPHEAKMASILGRWRGFGQILMYTLIPICAYTFLHHPDFAVGAGKVQAVLNGVAEEPIRNQVTTAATLSQMLPVGIKGMLASIFLLGLIACDASYLHSWGSIFIQDVVMPFRKTPFKPGQHLLLLRLAILSVAIFGFIFSLLYRQTGYVLMFQAITGAIYMGGAGAVLIGGLYWKKGTNAAAWAAMTAGSFLSLAGLMVQQPVVWGWLRDTLGAYATTTQSTWIAHLVSHWPAEFPINGQYMLLIAMLTAIILYVSVSLLTCTEDFNMDRMLHRGQYAIEPVDGVLPAPVRKHSKLAELVGIDSEFTRGDRVLAWSVTLWSLFWFLLFVVITTWNLISRWPLKWWGTYWHCEVIVLPLFVMAVTTVWFWWGGVRDLFRLFRKLQTVRRNDADDGMVIGHHNRDETSQSNSTELSKNK